MRELRAKGCSPKQIARALGLKPATVAPVVRAIAAREQTDTAERAIYGCWVNRGWSQGLTVVDQPSWPGIAVGQTADFDSVGGLVSVLVARDDGRNRVRLYGYLVDVYCLGVKNVVGPRVMDAHAVAEFTRSYFSAYTEPPLAAPVELARNLVFGAVDYARKLGFTPAADFETATGHLGPPTGPNPIGFGRDGKPFFIQGPRDNATAVLNTLERSVGSGNFHYLITA